MPLFITQGRFTHDAIKSLLAHPEDRYDVVARLADSVGAKLLAYYITQGEYDWLTVAEAPSAQTAAAFVLAAASSGAVSDVKTVGALTTAEAKEAYAMAGRAAGAYVPPGKA